MCQPLGGAMGTVCRRESVIDKDVAVPRQCFCEFRLVLFLPGMKAGVFQEQNVAVYHRINRLLCGVPDAVGCEMNPVIEDAFDNPGNRVERH